MFNLYRPAAFEYMVHRFDKRSGRLLGVEFAVSSAYDFVQREIESRQISIVHGQVPVVPVHKIHGICGSCEGAVLFLALSQLLLHTLAFSDIFNHAFEAGDVSIGVANRPDTIRYPCRAAAFPVDLNLENGFALLLHYAIALVALLGVHVNLSVNVSNGIF